MSENTVSWKTEKQITTFIKLSADQHEKQIAMLLSKYSAQINESQEEYKVQAFYLQPFKDLAFTSDVDLSGYVHGSQLNPNPQGVIVIGPILFALLILLVSIFNFTNTSIVFASNRLKEIGMRKLFGTAKGALMKQFMAENIVLCSAALLIALAGSYMALPFFNEAMQIDLAFNLTKNIFIIPFLIGIVMITAFLAGYYPAFHISRYKPIQILKGKATFTTGVLNKVLLVIQFTICSLTLVIGICMMQNASYQENSYMGYDLETIQVTLIESERDYMSILSAMNENPGVNAIAGSTHQLGANNSYSGKAVFENIDLPTQVLEVGSDYITTMGVRVLEGRDFSSEHESDFTDAILVNETFIGQFSMANALGKTVLVDHKPFTIIGIVNDYKEFGNHDKIPPVVFKAAKANAYRYAVVKSKKENFASVVQDLQATWKKNNPDRPYSGFAQTEVREKEIRLSKGFSSVSFFMSVLTMLLSAAGLYSLVSLNILQRMKEIAIRKILGAPVFKILAVINKSFIMIVFIAFFIGSALAYLIVDMIIFRFIYAYHSDMTVTPFLIALASILIGVLLIVGTRIAKAVNANPVEVLKID